MDMFSGEVLSGEEAESRKKFIQNAVSSGKLPGWDGKA